MGMFSEVHAEQTAKKLEEIILRAMNDSKYGDHRSAVRGFVKEELVEWYYWECGDSYGIHTANPEIKKMFPPKES